MECFSRRAILNGHKMKEPWFKNGLRFYCTGCGRCCTGKDGYVFLSSQDRSTLIDFLKISEKEFIDQFTRIVDGQLSLIDAPDSDHCIFLKNNRCSVYSARPIQCRTFPWWLHNIENPQNWLEAAKNCEGINHPNAKIVPQNTISEECMRYIDNLASDENEPS